MPLHTFHCVECGHSHDELYRATEDVPPAIPCPRCGQPAQRPGGYASALNIKGQGVYKPGFSAVKGGAK